MPMDAMQQAVIIRDSEMVEELVVEGLHSTACSEHLIIRHKTTAISSM